MKRRYLYTAAAVCISMALTVGCAKSGTSVSGTVETTQGMTAQEIAGEFEQEEVDIDWKNMDYTTLDVSSGSVTIEESGIYLLTGEQKDGSITVETNKETDTGIVYLVLDQLTIGSTTTAPIYIKEAQKVVMLLADGGVNTVTQGADIETDEKDNPSSAIFSKADLTIAGNGELHVTTEFNDGITSKDELKIMGGTIEIKAAGDGIVGKDALAVETVDLTVEAGKDGMKASNDTDTSKGNLTISDGTFNITAGNDAISAKQVLQIDGGTFELSTSGGYPGESINQSDTGMDAQTEAAEETIVSDSKKALKAGGDLIVKGGNFTISSYDDAVHSNADVTISGGNWEIESGDDGIHADNTVTIENGQIIIQNSYEGIEGSNITIQEGTIEVTSSDDGINVSSQEGTLTINGGTVTVKSGGDGLDSNGNIVQNGGDVIIYKALIGAGDTPVDYDGTFTANNGTLVDENGDTISHESEAHGGGRGQKMPGKMEDGELEGRQPDGELPSGEPPEGEQPKGGAQRGKGRGAERKRTGR